MSHHWIYFAVGNEADSGTIIDFLNNRTRWSLGDIRKELRPWNGTAAHQITRPQADLFQKEVKPIKRDQIGPFKMQRYLQALKESASTARADLLVRRALVLEGP